jgi:hypothetical protein
MIVYWERLKTPLTILQKYFIGECFTNPILSDAALYEITRLLLLDTEEKLKLQYNLSINWHIEFYISKCLDDNIPNK